LEELTHTYLGGQIGIGTTTRGKNSPPHRGTWIQTRDLGFLSRGAKRVMYGDDVSTGAMNQAGVDEKKLIRGRKGMDQLREYGGSAYWQTKHGTGFGGKGKAVLKFKERDTIPGFS